MVTRSCLFMFDFIGCCNLVLEAQAQEGLEEDFEVLIIMSVLQKPIEGLHQVIIK